MIVRWGGAVVSLACEFYRRVVLGDAMGRTRSGLGALLAHDVGLCSVVPRSLLEQSLTNLRTLKSFEVLQMSHWESKA